MSCYVCALGGWLRSSHPLKSGTKTNRSGSSVSAWHRPLSSTGTGKQKQAIVADGCYTHRVAPVMPAEIGCVLVKRRGTPETVRLTLPLA